MKKMKLLTIVLFVLGAGGAALAAEVISIDLNGYNDANAYTGEAAVPGATVWRAYYGGWGKAMGSPRSANLADYNEPNKPGTYAAQVWIGDNGQNHVYISGSALMDDGFDANDLEPVDPCISLIGLAQDPCLGGGAYTGVFDIYVYGSEAGAFRIRNSVIDQNQSVSGGFIGDFNEGQNYVVFNGVSIDEANEVYLTYTNVLNGLQLVKLKEPVAMSSYTVISAPDYDLAYETNQRVGEGSPFGPDIVGDPVPMVAYLDAGEYMEYDIIVDEANEGFYNIVAYLNTPEGLADDLDIYLDGLLLGTLYLGTTQVYWPSENNVSVNLFEGSHTFKWVSTGPELWFNIADFEFTRVDDVVMNDCNDVYKYGFNYAADYTGDCHVDEEDLALLVDNWLNCYDPNTDNCP